MDDQKDNENISSDCVLVENYFGRMCILWTVMSNKYKWPGNKYDMICKLCVSLTNIHIFWHPLRERDGEFYRAFVNRIYEIGENEVKRRSQTQSSIEIRYTVGLILTYMTQIIVNNTMSLKEKVFRMKGMYHDKSLHLIKILMTKMSPHQHLIYFLTKF